MYKTMQDKHRRLLYILQKETCLDTFAKKSFLDEPNTKSSTRVGGPRSMTTIIK